MIGCKYSIDINQLRAGHRRTLSRAITLIESTHIDHQMHAKALVNSLFSVSGNSLRIGISGTPGVGKSTFIEAIGHQILAANKKLAVLAVDPTSPVKGGSIMGDKTRMENLARDPNVYIRPSPSSCSLGGVAQKTREAMHLCEAAGFDCIIIETVGVGQSECQVANMTDFFLMLMQPGSGDGVQSLKKGVIELADAIVINKADGDLKTHALRAQRDYQQALDLLAEESPFKKTVLTCSAINGDGVMDIWRVINAYHAASLSENRFEKQRHHQNVKWMNELYDQYIHHRRQSNPQWRGLSSMLHKKVVSGEMTPMLAAKELFEQDLRLFSSQAD